MCPPPRRSGDRREPARALPVPFWRYIFLVVPRTSPRVFDLWVPRRWLAWYITTTSCSSCWLIFGASAAGSMSYLPTSLPLLLKTGRLTMADTDFGKLSLPYKVCFTDHDIGPIGARHRAVDEEQVVFGVDLGDGNVAGRDALMTVAAGHLLALFHAAATAVGRERASAAHVAMDLLHTVRGPLSLEIVPLHGPAKAAAFREARDIDRFHAVEHADRHVLADLRFANGAAVLADESLRLAAGFVRQSDAGGHELLGSLAVELGNVTTLTATGQAAGLIEKAQLHRFVAIALRRANLEHATRARLNDGDGDAIPRRIVNLCDPDLAAEYSLGHR